MANARTGVHDASSASERHHVAPFRRDTPWHRPPERERVDTAVRTSPTSAADPAAVPPRPAPRLLTPPRWLDLRLVLGVLLVLGSVLLGARVVSAADATVPVWAAAGDLAAGTVLTADDLVAVDVRLDDAANAYLATSTQPAGRTLSRAVSAGELLPRATLVEPDEL